MLTSIWNIIILPVHLISGLNENANSFFPTRCRFWTVKSSQTLLDEIDQSAQISVTQRKGSTNQRRVMSSEGGVWKNESFGSRWANKVKINAYKKMKVFFLTLHACQPVVGDSQNQNMNLSWPSIQSDWPRKCSRVVVLRAEVWQMSGCVRVVTERWWGCSPEKRAVSHISSIWRISPITVWKQKWVVLALKSQARSSAHDTEDRRVLFEEETSFRIKVCTYILSYFKIKRPAYLEKYFQFSR